MKYVPFALPFVLLASTALAQVPEDVLKESFIESNPEGISLEKMTVLSQEQVNDTLWEVQAQYTISGDENLLKRVDIIHERAILKRMSEEEDFIIDGTVRVNKFGNSWRVRQFTLNNIQEARDYLTNVRVEREWDETALIKGTPDYEEFIEQAEKDEQERYSNISRTLSGGAECQGENRWDLTLTWQPNKERLGAIETSLTLTDFDRQDTFQYEGNGYIDEKGNIGFRHNRTYEQTLGFDGRQWPSLVELESPKEGTSLWEGETIRPDTSICSVELKEEKEGEEPWKRQEKEETPEQKEQARLYEEIGQDLATLSFARTDCSKLKSQPISFKPGETPSVYSTTFNKRPITLSITPEGGLDLDMSALYIKGQRMATYSSSIEDETAKFEVGDICSISFFSHNALQKDLAYLEDDREKIFQKLQSLTNLTATFPVDYNTGPTQFRPQEVNKQNWVITGTARGMDISNWKETADMTFDLSDLNAPKIEFDIPTKDTCNWTGSWETGSLVFTPSAPNSMCMAIEF